VFNFDVVIDAPANFRIPAADESPRLEATTILLAKRLLIRALSRYCETIYADTPR
jgi:hypothetical protein